MTNDGDRSPRFAIEITEEQRDRANRLLNIHGTRRAIMSLLLDEVLDLIEEHGPLVIGILLNHNLKPRAVLPSLRAVDDVTRRLSDGNS